MATAQALQQARSAGSGPGPVVAGAGFSRRADLLPTLSFGRTPAPWIAPLEAADAAPLGLYALSDHVAGLRALLAAGLRTLQLRIKVPGDQPGLTETIIEAVQACQAAGAQLFINDHLGPVLRLIEDGQLRIMSAPGASGTAAPPLGVHLGQEDLMALGDAGRAELAASGLAVGVSSHSLWELARSRGVAPAYIACGPVWPTLTKAMPWHSQGTANLAWWVAAAGRPVVAIGGILVPEQARQAAASGASGVCLVRAVATDLARTVPAFAQAWLRGRTGGPSPAPVLPRPSLGD
jgi:hydroxymethylpyrimidine kinase/phosphomethylpyrimidine kinase/thiamine-phosphate diphosphorylase